LVIWQAFLDVEQDLTERETPMDRLICGDVGFGKTEVALRAIFYVVSAGKQAMVLAPTIVLAKQHYEVICDRYYDYPDIKVALLSRFQVYWLRLKNYLLLECYKKLMGILGFRSLWKFQNVYQLELYVSTCNDFIN